MGAKLDKIFDSFSKEGIFSDKTILQTNYNPQTIPHRDKEIEQLASILAPALRGERTSNLFLYGKTGCIAGDSLVYTDKGWKKIKEVDAEKDLVVSFNKEKKSYEWSGFVFLRFENKSPLLRVKLENGEEIIVTKDHPLLTGGMDWKKADELVLGEEVAIGCNLPNMNNNEIPLAMARLLGFTISDGSLNKRERRTKDGRGNWYNSNRQRFRYFSEDSELLALVQKDLKSLFSCTPSLIVPKDRCRHINVISQQVCSCLNGMGIVFGSKSYVVEVPKVVLEASPIIQREFLKALFSGDGTVSQNTFMIEYYSNSEKLLQQVSLLLHQEGVACKIKPKPAKCNGKLFNSFRLYISGEQNLLNFYNKIGFYSKEKQRKLGEMFKRYKVHRHYEEKTFLTSKIAKIEETFEPFVYDLTVPVNHNFIANGIISHNTGKTLSVQFVRDEMIKRAQAAGVKLRIEYINCKLKKVSDTEYRILAEFIKKLGGEVPATGLPTDAVYNKFLEIVDSEKQVVLLILDEIDQAVKKISDSFLYNLTRLNTELSKAQISLVGISNDLTFLDNLDPRVRSSLSEEEVVFAPYNALQLQDILKERADKAFKKGVVGGEVINKCAAFAAREHGDARRALDLLRIAGELAERDDSLKIKEEHIDKANEKIEKEKILDIILTEPKQFQLTLLSIMQLSESQKLDKIFTGDIYNVYQELCQKTGNEVLTQRRVSDIIAEFDMLGLITATVISKGRYGRTREIKLAIPSQLMGKAREIIKTSLDV